MCSPDKREMNVRFVPGGLWSKPKSTRREVVTLEKRVRVPPITPDRITCRSVDGKVTEAACKAAAFGTTGCESQRSYQPATLVQPASFCDVLPP